MKEEARRILLKAFQEQGEKLFSNRALCLSLLRDYGGNNHHEFTLLAEGVDVGIPHRLSNFVNGDFDAGVAEAMACDFCVKRYYEIDFCRWVVESWAMCFGLKSADVLTNRQEQHFDSKPITQEWYYIANEERVGPVQKDLLISLIESGNLPPDTLVWGQETSEWKSAQEQFDIHRQTSRNSTVSIVAPAMAVKSLRTVSSSILKPFVICVMVLSLIIGLGAAYWFGIYLPSGSDTTKSPTEAQTVESEQAQKEHQAAADNEKAKVEEVQHKAEESGNPKHDTVEGPSLSTRDSEGFRPGSVLALVGISKVDSADAPDKKFTLKIPLKRRSDVNIDSPNDVVIHVFFYDMLDDGSIVQTDANLTYRWTTLPVNWNDSNIEILEVDYAAGATSSGQTHSEIRKYFGYIVRIYYKNKIQDMRAEPNKLLKQYPPPLTLTSEESKDGEVEASKTQMMQTGTVTKSIVGETNQNKKSDEIAVIKTSEGEMVMEFWPEVAPNTVDNFKKLAKQGFYDDTLFHRIIKGFMIQGGDPLTKDRTKEDRWGTGGPGYNLKAEFNEKHHAFGVVSMARSADPDSAGSQFFICLGDADSLDHKYTAFGKLIKGEDILSKIGDIPVTDSGRGESSKPTKAVKIQSIKIVSADSEK